jgi:predicted kinase
MLIVLRSLPGAGKSTLAQKIKTQLEAKGSEVIICSSDHYFICPACKEYTFVKDRLGAAHFACQKKCAEAMDENVDVIIIDNTCVSAKECRVYVELALFHGYDVEFLEPETSWAFDLDELEKRNVHKVPREALERMLGRWVPNMTMKKALGIPEINESAPHLDETAASSTGVYVPPPPRKSFIDYIRDWWSK